MGSPEFAVVCPDGSYPLRWTELHHQYSAMFESQLDSVIQQEGMNRDDFRGYMADIAEEAQTMHANYYICPSITVADFWEFLDNVTASENFDRFLKIMFHYVQHTKLPHQAPGYEAISQPA